MNDEPIQQTNTPGTRKMEAESPDQVTTIEAIPRRIDVHKSPGGSKPPERIFWSPRLNYSIAITAGIMAFILLHFFAYVIWRLHGPQYTIGKDGWVHMRDRTFGFEMDLPSQYQEYAIGAGQSHVYRAKFNNKSVPEAWVSVQVYQPARKATDALTLKKTIESRSSQGTVTIIDDRSTDRTAPMIDFLHIDLQNTPTRRRVLLNNNAEMEIVFYDPKLISVEELRRVLDSVRWMK